MNDLAYPLARAASTVAREHFERGRRAAEAKGARDLGPEADAGVMEAVIGAAFWASLRREEGFSPKISLAYLPPERATPPLKFKRALPLDPATLARLAPAVERPGIHLGVWPADGGAANELRVWGTTRATPRYTFVLEVIEPGLLVVKYRRGREAGKYVNVLLLQGDQLKVVDEAGTSLPDCPPLILSLVGFGAPAPAAVTGAEVAGVNVLVQLAASMRAHNRGGTLLVVPAGSTRWRESIVRPVSYAVAPPFDELANLVKRESSEGDTTAWQEALIDAVDAVAGLTAVDGAVVINDRYELLAFGAKIARREGGPRVEQLVLTEPVVGDAAAVVHPSQLGGTRHLSAAQFVHDQRDAVALVASQDGRFTVCAWSPCESLVHAHRVESLLM